MIIDLNPILSEVSPWELSLFIGATKLDIKRLSNADVKRLSLADKFPTTENLSFVRGLVESDADAHIIDETMIDTIIAAIGAYYMGTVVSKKVQAAAGLVARQMQLQRHNGSNDSPSNSCA